MELLTEEQADEPKTFSAIAHDDDILQTYLKVTIVNLEIFSIKKEDDFYHPLFSFQN